MYWKRSTYFWTFIGATLAAYIATWSSSLLKDFYQFEFILICLGAFLSYVWLLVNKSSKFWQENWEYHIDMLEDGYTGPLYKTVKTGSKHSVSRLNTLINLFMIGLWIILGVRYYLKNHLKILPSNFNIIESIDWFSWTIFISTIVLCRIAYRTRTRKKDSEKVGFTYRERIPNK